MPAGEPSGSAGEDGGLVDNVTGVDNKAGIIEMDGGSVGETTDTVGGIVGETDGTAETTGVIAGETDGTARTAKTTGKSVSDTGGTARKTETAIAIGGNVGEAAGETEAIRSTIGTAEGTAGGNANCTDYDDMGYLWASLPDHSMASSSDCSCSE